MPAAAPETTTFDLLARSGAVKEAGMRGGALLVGIASAEAFNEHVPEGHRPSDILPGAKSVVVAGNQGPTAAAWHSPDHRVMEITGYDFRENVAIHVMCDYIEREYGYQALQAPSLPTAGHHPPMSMMLAAVLAGLGTRSLAANIILNPTYGLLYYAALVTTLELEPDQRLEKDACPSPYCIQMWKKLGTTPCLASCPSDQGGCLDGSLDESGRIDYSYYNRERCHTRSMNFGIGSVQKSLLDILTEDDSDTRRSMIYSDFFTQSVSALTYYKESVAQCFECMRVCPVGQNTKRLK
jgi:epoxyqueuosine reductase QueG